VSPDFEQLLQIIHVSANHYECAHVVLASLEGYRFLEVNDQLPRELEAGLEDGYLALGLLGWRISAEGFQAQKLFFRWHEAPELGELFDDICDAGADSARKQLRDNRAED
jgi:hypothetical protein